MANTVPAEVEIPTEVTIPTKVADLIKVADTPDKKVEEESEELDEEGEYYIRRLCQSMK